MSEPASDERRGRFVAGFAPRQDDAAVALHARRSGDPGGFTPADLIARIESAFGARSPVPTTTKNKPPAGPRHFSPADRDANPTQGWDPLDTRVDEATTFVDPVAVARASGFEEGVASARALLDEDAARDRALLGALVAQLRDGAQFDRAAIATRLRQTVLHLVSALVGEIGVSEALLNARVASAAELLADVSEAAILRLHPDDVALVTGNLPDTIFPVGDSSVARGAFVLEAASTIVEDGPQAWLDQLAGAIDQVPVPSC